MVDEMKMIELKERTELIADLVEIEVLVERWA